MFKLKARVPDQGKKKQHSVQQSVCDMGLSLVVPWNALFCVSFLYLEKKDTTHPSPFKKKKKKGMPKMISDELHPWREGFSFSLFKYGWTTKSS